MSAVRAPGFAISRQMRRARATSLPASRIRPISRSDLYSGAFWMSRRSTSCPPIEAAHHVLVNVLDRPDGRDDHQPAALAVVVQQGGRAVVKDLEPFPDDALAVVVPLHQRLAVVVADPRRLGRPVRHVVN